MLDLPGALELSLALHGLVAFVATSLCGSLGLLPPMHHALRGNVPFRVRPLGLLLLMLVGDLIAGEPLDLLQISDAKEVPMFDGALEVPSRKVRKLVEVAPPVDGRVHAEEAVDVRPYELLVQAKDEHVLIRAIIGHHALHAQVQILPGKRLVISELEGASERARLRRVLFLRDVHAAETTRVRIRREQALLDPVPAVGAPVGGDEHVDLEAHPLEGREEKPLVRRSDGRLRCDGGGVAAGALRGAGAPVAEALAAQADRHPRPRRTLLLLETRHGADAATVRLHRRMASEGCRMADEEPE